MCGIIGAFNRENAFQIVQTGLSIIKERGRDGYGYYDGKKAVHKKSIEEFPSTDSKNVLGHSLHSIVGEVFEPIEDGGAILSANCEIYNWKELAKTHSIDAENDAVLLLKLINMIGVGKALVEVRGVYAFAYWKKDEVVIARDIIGVKPLWYSTDKGFIFCSEKKGIEKFSKSIMELNPRTVLTYNLKTKKEVETKREFFALEPRMEDEKEAISGLKEALTEAVSIRVPNQKFGLLFSGGIDSALIAKLLGDSGREFTCYVAGMDEGSSDVISAKEAAQSLGLSLKIVLVKKNDVEKYLKKVVPLIEDSNVVKVGVALALYAACEEARKDGCRVIFAGSGADEVFGGYHRYKSSLSTLNKDCYSDVLRIYEKNSYRDDVVTMNNNLELRVPFLDKEVVSLGLRLAPSLKIKAIDEKNNKNNEKQFTEKHILRTLALKLGIGKNIASRPKKAAQYGSGVDKTIEGLAKKQKKSKSAYLSQFYSPSNVKLGALLSSGKDSLFAAYTMQKQNYSISCGITIKSSNPDSFMFHTPNIDLVKLQCESMGIPLVMVETAGEKEEELHELKIALQKAKEEHGIEGIVSGALFSNYQRERIENVADSLGLKLFSPLWHMDQEQELRQLLREGFEIIFVKVAAEGLDSSWLGRKITGKDVDELVKLSKKFGINIAGEGGEYESLVLDCPMFGKRISIKTNNFVNEGVLFIQKGILSPKSE